LYVLNIINKGLTQKVSPLLFLKVFSRAEKVKVRLLFSFTERK
jgi:hypothetical protein